MFFRWMVINLAFTWDESERAVDANVIVGEAHVRAEIEEASLLAFLLREAVRIALAMRRDSLCARYIQDRESGKCSEKKIKHFQQHYFKIYLFDFERFLASSNEYLYSDVISIFFFH